ncbi:MAG: hypothetical protein QOJ76_1297 [Acidobacteriota bacterium]|nr:hypothetical protein [Acidobacteriota bacterium]
MKRLAAISTLVALLVALSCLTQAAAQTEGVLRIASVGPYDRVVPGQIVELRVEGFGERFTSPPEGDALRIQLTQDGSTQTASARTASPVFIRDTTAAVGGGAPANGGGTLAGGGGPEGMGMAGMKAYQAVSFVVPRGLHVGEAEVVVAYRGRRSAPAKLNIVERPLRPVVGGTPIMTIGPVNLPPPKRGDAASSFGLRFERGAKRVELHVRPLSDPADADASVLVRFKQGGTFYDAESRVVHHEKKNEQLDNGGVRFTPTRDALEVDVPELLAPGEAELEVRLRVNGQTGDAAVLPVTITDAARAYEAPKEAAPRMLAVTPHRVGAGQPLLISVDRRRTLDPDASKVVVVVEGQDGTRDTLKPESNSAVLNPSTPPDAPVLLIARPTKKVIGPAKIQLMNPARSDYEGGASEPAQVEIVEDALPPEVVGVSQSTGDELAQLRRMYETQKAAGRRFPEYDPTARYVTIRANGLDYNPKFLRVRFEQEGREAVTLGPGDFSLFSNNSVIVRVPKDFDAGATRLSVENRGASGYSTPVVKTFELSPRP